MRLIKTYSIIVFKNDDLIDFSCYKSFVQTNTGNLERVQLINA